ncbi:hypothetical protein QKT49_gp418 [Acanthamoeba castellanii medusavirus]|uniref:Uncharacterized protein n=1 Tax=Acanthamoeba castellanii medusavirus J1 TaxID=3114988 RepID=A0A3T1CX13_9VIRU|nr:hypothetical protein QKT49_gp418 [Acanthamoeba castellanii medusavirus]BBI30345.1 hypothetical protein [Acanthamoeba castellanii medusavirus J1]
MGSDNPFYLGYGVRVSKDVESCEKALKDAGIDEDCVKVFRACDGVWLILRPKRFMWATVPCEDRCVWMYKRGIYDNLVTSYERYVQPARDSRPYWYEWSDVRVAARRYRRRERKRSKGTNLAMLLVVACAIEGSRLEAELIVWDHWSY